MKLRKKICRSACILTVGVMILFTGAVFTGCSNSGDSSTAGNNSIVADEENTKKTFAYTVCDIEPEEDSFYSITGKNGLLYTVSYDSKKHGDIWYNDANILVMDETGKTQLTIPVFEQTEDNEFFTVCDSFIIDDSGNITCIAVRGTYESNGRSETYHILTFDAEGNPVSDNEIDPIITNEDNLNGRYLGEFITDNEGNIYCDLNTCVRVLDKTGAVLFTTDEIDTSNGYMQSLILTNSGVPAVGIQEWGENPVSKLVEIDLNAQDFGEEHILPDEYVNNVYSGSGDYLCYIPNDTGISGYRADTLEKESVLNLLNLGIDTTQLDTFISCGDGSFLTGGWTYSGGAMGKMKYSYIKPVDSSEVKERQVITLGCFSMDQFWRSAVANFNRTNEDYIISSVSYSDNNDTSDYDAALTKFNNELLSGNIPDILLLYNQRTFDSYTKKGLLTDLYTLIDNDPDLSRDSFLPNILAAMETDGKLYKIPVSFSISAYAAKTALVGDVKNITLSEAKELVDRLPEGAVLTNDTDTRMDFLLIALWYSNFIDYENGTCNFDSPQFREILETAAAYPAEINYNTIDYTEKELAVKNDKALLYNAYFYDFETYSRIKKGIIGEDITLVGFPNSDGLNGTLNINTTVSISEKSQNKEGAWEFIKTTLDDFVTENEREIFNRYAETGAEPVTEMRWEANSLYMGFPVLADDLERLGMQSTIPEKIFNEDGEIVPQENTYYITNSIQIKNEPLTEDEAHELIEYLTSVDNLYRYDANIDSIINEEVSSFFGGAKSADETAKAIQSRASIYLSEQYR